MTDYVLPASPSWYCSRVTDANEYGLLVFGAKNSIFIWDVNVKPPRHKGYFRAHQERVVGVSLCRHQLSQPKCCSAGEDGKIKIWNLDSQALLTEHSEHKVVYVDNHFVDENKFNSDGLSKTTIEYNDIHSIHIGIADCHFQNPLAIRRAVTSLLCELWKFPYS